MPRYYPVYLDVQGRRCAVFGGNSEAERKVNYLLESGADVMFHAPASHTTGGLKAMAAAGKVAWRKRAYRKGDLEGAWLAIVADTTDPDRNELVFREARERNVVLNVMDVPHLCTFIAPAVVQRKDVTVAVSTGGASPALARRLREEMSSPACRCMRWAGVGPVLAAARRDIRSQKVVVCPDVWQELMTEQWLTLAETKPVQAQKKVAAALTARHCEDCAPFGRCQKHV